MTLQIRVAPDAVTKLAQRVQDDFEAFAYDGFGVKLSNEQMEARQLLGRPGPREKPQDPRFYFLSGGQRSGKTVLAYLTHAEANLYKSGLDNTDQVYWRNYLYRTLNIAPTDELALRMWMVALTMSTNSNEAQWDRRLRRSRPGAFCQLAEAKTEGRWGIVRFRHATSGLYAAQTSMIDFRSSEGKAKRLEGTFWQYITWDEWASQPENEIEFILEDVLMGRARDRDAKVVPMAWPKAETERHLIAVERALETGVGKRAKDSAVIYLSAEAAYFTNKAALATERSKDPAKWKRTVQGRTAGGASIEFTQDLLTNMVNEHLPRAVSREDGFHYLTTADLGLGHDSTVIGTWRIPLISGKPTVDVNNKARLVHAFELKGSADLTIDTITFEIAREVAAYRSISAVDATGMGGLIAVRQLRDMKPPPLAFKSRSNDRVWGNMRLAAITNGLDLVSWGKPTDEGAQIIRVAQAAWDALAAMGRPITSNRPAMPAWGLIETPAISDLIDQMANFDRTAKDGPSNHDDWVWMALIAMWYIRRYWVTLGTVHQPRPFDARTLTPLAQQRRSARLLKGVVAPAVDLGIRSVRLPTTLTRGARR